MTFNNIVLYHILRDKWTYFAYFLSSVFSIFIFFCFSVSMFHPDLSLIANGSALSMAMMAGAVLVYLFSFMFIFYSIISFMKVKEKTLGLFVMMGASRLQIKQLLFRENMLIGLAAILAAITLGLVFAPLFLKVAKKIMQVEGFAMYFPYKAIILTVLMFFILFLLISFVSPYFVRKQKLIQLLKSDKKPEKEVRFSPANLILASILVGFSLPLLTVWHDALFIRSISQTIRVPVLFIVFVIGLYLLYMQVSVFMLNIIQKQEWYFRKTNLLTFSGLKSQIRTNVKIMYLVSLLLIGTFFTIVILYSGNVNVEQNTKLNYPYNYMYISKAENPNEQEHVGLLQQILSSRDSYTFYKFEVLYNEQDGRQAIISESEYNQAVQGMGGRGVSLNQDEIYMVSGSPKIRPGLNFSPQLQAVFQKAGMAPHVVGESTRNMTPPGYFRQMIVLSEHDYMTLRQMQLFHSLRVFAYNIDNWKENSDTDQFLKQHIGFSDDGEFGFFSAGELFRVEKNTKNLLFYVGFMLSLIFMIAALSMIYFRLITDLDKEREKYKGIMKLGLSKKELSTILSRQLAVLFFAPFIVASTIFFIGMMFLQKTIGGSLGAVTVFIFALFLVVQSLGYFVVNTKYRKSLMKRLINHP